MEGDLPCNTALRRQQVQQPVGHTEWDVLDL